MKKLLNIKAVIEIATLSRATIYRKIKNGTFPAPEKISARSNRWPEESINEWLKNPEEYRTHLTDNHPI